MANENGEKTITINNSTMTYVLVGLLVLAAFAIGMLWTKVQGMDSSKGQGNTVNTGTAPTPNADGTQSVKVEGVSESDHVRGNRDAKMALIEYSDLECPFCQRFHPTAQQVVDEYDGEVMWVYRHFPLSQLHPKAQKFAEATECAAKIGGEDKFWELNDKIVVENPELAELNSMAAGLGINESEFDKCMTSGETASIVKAHVETGTKAGVRGTPGNIILNIETGEAELLAGAVPFASIQSVIDRMMAQ